ncbi:MULTISPECIES: DUF7112 family protein [Halolamina]|uniref:Uncharacterized protein n=1 Tax=Halolamina pelagica TaxID=699431 RepID=A0A1I5PY92_9EURY|nr:MULTISPECIES: hypothetical protein [Halolamina]NHX35001.1 hypothetical protein [Halolamina sp. R1-12]SFP38829.1 hypothetical protein SAMN05216277_103158 [Halolamina pelagica]
MSDRIPSDHASVHTERAEVARSGGTRRPCLHLPADLALEPGSFVRLVIAGDEYHAEVREDRSGFLLRGAYDLKSEARDPGRAENRLVEWLRDEGREPGDPVEIDEIEPGERYGLRLPGERTFYRDTSGPGGSLQDIASDLDGVDSDG